MGGKSIEAGHKAILFAATVVVKTSLMVLVATQVFCGNIDPRTLFLQCGDNYPFVAASAAAVALMGIIFGRYIARLKSFNKIFPNMMKADFIVTAMYFGVGFTAPALVASKVMIWLFGTWILGMLLAPFNSERSALKKVAEYGSIAALGAFLGLHFVPQFQEMQSSYTIGMMISSIVGVFGGGRQK